jgi:hypothetical protein
MKQKLLTLALNKQKKDNEFHNSHSAYTEGFCITWVLSKCSV